MNWVDKPLEDRKADVARLFDKLIEESPDRFWLSNDQDGPHKQIMRIVLPIPKSGMFYDITMLTAQLKAARLIAYDLGQKPGERLAITPALLGEVGVVSQESFEFNRTSDFGVGLEIVVDADGLTHQLIDDLLGAFIDSGEQPPVPGKIDPVILANRLVMAREERRQADYPL